jgi:4-amino-4-deoxy-L-arabinose transferase-like glycosyltransferase
VTERRYRTILGAIAAAALAVRLAWVAWAARRPTSFFLDPARYLGYAEQIAAGNGMVEGITGDPTAYYPPGYPWFLGVVVWASQPFTDRVWITAGIVQAVLGAATVLLAARVARRLSGPTAGLVAAGVMALYPNLIFHTGALLGETLYNVLFLAFLALLIGRGWTESFGWWRLLGCGVLLGLAVMVRPISLAVIPVVALAFLWSRKDWGIALRWTAVLTLGVVACVVPWTVRNAVRLDAFVLISTNTGDNLCIGHADGATGSFTTLEACTVPYPFTDGLSAELKADKAKQRIAREGFVDNIEREPWLMWRRVYFMWVRDGDHDGLFAVQSYRQDRWMAIPTEARFIWIADRAYWLVVAAGLVGLVQLARSRQPEAFVLVGATVMTAAVPLIFFGDSRFKVPVIPLLIVAAATLVRRADPADHVASPADEPVPADEAVVAAEA